MDDVVFALGLTGLLVASTAGMDIRGYGRAARYPGGKFGITTNRGYVNPLSARLRNVPVNRQLFGNSWSCRVGKQTIRRSLRGRYRTSGGYRRRQRTYQMPEVKNYDVGFTLAASSSILMPATAATGAILVDLTQNNTATSRIGRKITLKTIQVEGNINFAGGANPEDTAHMVVFIDTQSNKAFPATADVFTNGGAVASGFFRDLDNQKRFRILCHERIELDAGAGVAAAFASCTKPWHFYKKVNLPIYYTGATGAIGEITQNNVYVAMGSDIGTTTFAGRARVRFTDN